MGAYYNMAPNIYGTQKGAIILTTTHIEVWSLAFRVSDFAVWSEAPWAHRAFRFEVPQFPKGFLHEVLKGSSWSSKV